MKTNYDFMKTNKQPVLSLFLMLMSISCSAQIESFNFALGNEVNVIEFDATLYRTDSVTFVSPNMNYLNKVAKVMDDKIVDRYLYEYRYVFPKRIECQDSVYLMTFTASGLYATGYNRIMAINDFQKWLLSSLKKNDTVCLRELPTPWVGSANYLLGESYDVEFAHFRESRYGFLNYYFSLDESGMWYNFIGNDLQIPLIVSQLYTWGIFVIDGAGTDQRSTIAILAADYPNHFETSDVIRGKKILSEWKSVFGNKRLFRKNLFLSAAWVNE